MSDSSSINRTAGKRLISLHVFSCLCFVLLPFLFFPHPKDIMSSFSNLATIRDLIGQFILIGFFYLTYFVLIPKYYNKKRYTPFFLFILLCFLLTVFLPSMLTGHFNPLSSSRLPPPDRHQRGNGLPQPRQIGEEHHLPSEDDFNMPSLPPGPGQDDGFSDFFEEVSHHIFLFLVVLFFSLTLSSNNRWKQAEKEKTDAELSYLKAQINPHFLFNTLNSIYSLIIQKSDVAGEAIVKLSGMMRYVLYEANKDFVMLNEEIKYLHDYIELQKLRFGNQIPIEFAVSGPTDGRQIAPLLLISYVENACKHGVNAEEDSNISIHITVHENELTLQAHNNKVRMNYSDSSGIGMQNVKNRLQLIYPAKHTLTIEETDTYFLVILHIEL